jgi:hypothetical protein
VPTRVSTVDTPPVPAEQNLGEGLRRPCSLVLACFSRFLCAIMSFFLGGQREMQRKMVLFLRGPASAYQPRKSSRMERKFREISRKPEKKWRNRPDLKVYCLEHVYVLGFVARSKSPWEFTGSTGHLRSLLEPLCRSGLVFWQEILHIGTLRARYRAKHRNVTNATVSTICDGGEARVAFEDGMRKILPKKISRTSLRPMARICLKK